VTRFFSFKLNQLGKNLASICNILSDLLGKLGYAGKFDFIPDAFDKIDPNMLSINIIMKIQDMDFNRKDIVAEGGAVTDVGNSHELPVQAFNHYGVNAGFGAEFFLKHDVGGGKPQEPSPAIPAADHGAAHLIKPAQQFFRGGDLSLSDQLPDSRTADSAGLVR
jgi:hypothetical protein